MLAPFAPHLHKDEGLKASYSSLAARCLLAGKSDAIQVAPKPVNAFIRPDDDDGLIQDGSHVILYSTRDNIETLIVKRHATFDNKHGHFLHNDFIGKPYGSRVRPYNALNCIQDQAYCIKTSSIEANYALESHNLKLTEIPICFFRCTLRKDPKDGFVHSAQPLSCGH